MEKPAAAMADGDQFRAMARDLKARRLVALKARYDQLIERQTRGEPVSESELRMLESEIEFEFPSWSRRPEILVPFILAIGLVTGFIFGLGHW